MEHHKSFTEFFLNQAVEIEPATIKALIDEGFNTKLSLVCLDLIHDLPLIKLENLSQRAILRKYIAALQENCPFQLCIDETESTQQQAVPAVNTKPNKKRKHEKLFEDMDFKENEDQYDTGNIGGFSSVTSPVSLAYGASSFAPQPKEQQFSSPTSTLSGPSRQSSRVSLASNSPIQTAPASTPPNNIINETVLIPEKKPKGKGKKKPEVVRSKSQIRFHMEKERQSLATQEAPAVRETPKSNDEEMMDVEQPAVIIRSSSQAKKATKNAPAADPNVSPITPAAKALLAKIEQKNQSKGTRKPRARK